MYLFIFIIAVFLLLWTYTMTLQRREEFTSRIPYKVLQNDYDVSEQSLCTSYELCKKDTHHIPKKIYNYPKPNNTYVRVNMYNTKDYKQHPLNYKQTQQFFTQNPY